MAEFVQVERGDDGVALVRLDRPKMNALSAQLLGELAEAAVALRDDPPGAVVVWGGPRIFAAGADITEFTGPDDARRIGALFVEASVALEAIPRAVIAAVNGYALGGGCELALACDMRIAADDATFGQPEILLGIIPGGGGTQRLARLVGPSRAKDLILTGRQVQADEALRIGLADRLVPAGQVIDEARSLAARLAAGAVVAQGLAKHAVDRGLDGSLRDGLAVEQDAFVASFATEDARIGVASFLAQGPGKASFVGR